MTTAGAAKPIVNDTEPEQVQGGAAIPIAVVDGVAVEGGPVTAVYELSAAELAECGKSQGSPLRVSLAPARNRMAGPAIPVYVVSGSLGGGAALPNPVCLTWNDESSDETAFVVERSLVAGAPWVEIVSLAPGTEAYQDDSVETGTTYYYRVGAEKTGFDTSYSNISTITT